MRTRTRSQSINPTSTGGMRFRKKATRYSVTGGSFDGPPLVADGSYPPSPVNIPAWMSRSNETITDEGGGGGLTTIKSVDHTSSVPSVLPTTDYYNSEFSARVTTYPTLQDSRMMTNGQTWNSGCTTCSAGPIVAGVIAANGVALSSPDALTESILLRKLQNKPTDQLALLPSRLVRAIEEWHSSTTVIESRELPDLWTMFGRREPLATGLTSAVGYWSKYRTNSAARTLANLIEAYRSGHLGYAFGIMPTVSDVRKIASLVENGVRARKERLRVTLRGGDSTTIRTGSYPGTVNSVYYRYDQTEDIRIARVDGAYAVCNRPMYQNEAFASAVNRLAGVNGAGIIWEVIPFSWAVDMVLSIDDMLDVIWANTQTEYDIQYWSSTSVEYVRTVDTWRMLEPLQKGSASVATWEPNDPYIHKWKRFNRFPRAQPRPFDAAHFKGRATGLWLGLLVALGLVPPRYRGLAS